MSQKASLRPYGSGANPSKAWSPYSAPRPKKCSDCRLADQLLDRPADGSPAACFKSVSILALEGPAFVGSDEAPWIGEPGRVPAREPGTVRDPCNLLSIRVRRNDASTFSKRSKERAARLPSALSPCVHTRMLALTERGSMRLVHSATLKRLCYVPDQTHGDFFVDQVRKGR